MVNFRRLLALALFLAFCLVSLIQVERVSASPAMSLPKDTAKARIKYKPQPQYPDEAREKKIKATVILRAIFRSSGEVTNIKLARVVPDNLPEDLAKLFVDRSIEAARQIEFEPAVKNGKPVSMYVQLEYNFRSG